MIRSPELQLSPVVGLETSLGPMCARDIGFCDATRCLQKRAKGSLVVRMRDILGGCDDLEGPRQSVWMRRLVALNGKGWPGRETTSHDLIGRGSLEHALAAPVVGLVEALEQCLEVAMARDGDAEHFALHAAVGALGLTVIRHDVFGVLTFR
jgi:hypothetical protein